MERPDKALKSLRVGRSIAHPRLYGAVKPSLPFMKEARRCEEAFIVFKFQSELSKMTHISLLVSLLQASFISGNTLCNPE